MKPSTTSYLARLLLANLCAALLLGASYDSSKSSSYDMASEQEPSESTVTTEPTAPIIQHALDQAEQANSLQKLLSQKTMGRPGCETCTSDIPNIKYKACSTKNDYLEGQLLTKSYENSILGDLIRKPVRNNDLINPLCIEMSMNYKFGENSKVFRQCSADSASRVAYRPCFSEKYFQLMSNSFNLVSMCMKDHIAKGESEEMKKLDVRAVYAMANIESGFHVNAMSGTGAGGFGQFTSSAIQDVNVNELSAVRASLENSANPECGKLSMEFLDSMQPMRSNKAASCDRISITKGNPVTNMIYTYAYLTGVKKDMDSQIFQNRNYKTKFKLSAYDLAKIKRALMVWSHNTGPAGTWTPAKALLNSIYRNKAVTNADQFIDQLQQFMQRVPARANSSTARRNETSKYFPAITSTLNAIESNVGGGQCVK